MSKRNATGSWSGYLHQGKVGIFLVLTELRKLIEDKGSFEDWLVEFESAEDIDIKQGTKVVSRHQVKAYKKAKYPNDYKDVLGVQKYKKEKEKLKMISPGFQIYKFDENGKSIKLEVDQDSRYLHTITETIGFGLSKDEFNEKFKCIPNPPKYVDNPNNIKLYCYPNKQYFCELSADHSNDILLRFCTEEIKQILNLEKHIYKDDNNEHKQIYYYLLYKLDSIIRSKHLGGQKKFPSLSFNEVYSIVTDTKKYTEKHIAILRERFINQWKKFIEELEENNVEINERQETIVEKVVTDLYNLSDEKFIQFLKDMNPDKINVHNLETFEQMLELCKDDSLKDIFYDCLLDVEKHNFNIDYFGYDVGGGYHVTLINRKPAKVRTVIRNIFSNTFLTDAIFKRKYIINEKIDDIKIGSEWEYIDDADLKKNGVEKLKKMIIFLILI